MRTRCPCCGTTLSLDALVAHEDARECLQAAFGISGQLGAALVRYLALFRPAERELTLERVARLLGELLPDIRAGRISRGGKVFDAPLDAWVFALGQAVQARADGRLKTPLKTHGWLYEVISGYRPQAHQALVASEPGAAVPGKPASRTLAGIAALEAFKHGG